MIIVVGAGITGSSLSHHLRDRDIEHQVFDSGNPASVAAVALLRRGYHHGDQLALFDRSLELFKRWGVNVRQGGWVTNYRKPDREPREEADWFVIDPLEPLVKAVPATCYPLDMGVGTETMNQYEFYSASRVLWATGATRQPIGATFGVTWLHEQPDRALTMPDRVRLHHYAPYKTIAAAKVGRRARLGSSSASTTDGAVQQGRKMLQAAYEMGMISTVSGWTAELGMRCKGSELAGDGIHSYVGGFHRTGYAIAPAATERVVEAL
jgi:hypothetical protein